MTLPRIFGTTLSGHPRQFPADLPESPVALIFGFAHEARQDVGLWKQALARAGHPFLSLPSPVEDVQPSALAGIAEAMRVHVPPKARDSIVAVHRGAGALMEALGWRHDPHAKVLVTDRSGDILASHGHGPFSEEAFRVIAYALTHGLAHPTLEA